MRMQPQTRDDPAFGRHASGHVSTDVVNGAFRDTGY